VIASRETECCALAGGDCRPLLLRLRASRPQLKRDPLSSHELSIMAEAAAHAAAIAQAIKASGTLVRLEPQDFSRILHKQDAPLVVRARGGFFRTRWYYLTSYKGLAFFALCDEPLPLPGRAEVIDARKIWAPT